MGINITKLGISDLQRLDDLGSNYRNTIGFLTSDTLEEYLRRGRVLGAKAPSGDLVGFLLFADYHDRFRIAQLCVSNGYRGQGIARQMLEALKATASTQRVIKLRCRRDFPAHEMWPKLGFIPMGEKPGRSAQGHPLTLWCHHLRQDDDELGLWKAQASDEVLDVVIDAQIFFDLDAEDTAGSLISKGLLNDFLVDSLNLWITDELFLEIDRKSCDTTRKSSIDRAHGLHRISFREDLFERFVQALKDILPYQRPSEESDIRHLAKTAASDVKTFVTRDGKILQKTEIIRSLCGITVMHPSELITSFHELAERQSYTPVRVTGMKLEWRRMRGEDCAGFPDGIFQKHGESRGKLVESIRSLLAHPNTYRCEVLLSHSEMVAIRVTDLTMRGKLIVPLARIAQNSDVNLFSDFLIADTLSFSAENNREVVIFPTSHLTQHFGSRLSHIGFKERGDAWIRVVIAKSCSREEAHARIVEIDPDLDPDYRQLSSLDFERQCAPLASDESIPVFLVPIRPAFAMGLIDRRDAADDLFGGDPSVLLRWDNVYYRRKSRHHMLQAPARVLWYASGDIHAIVAVSHLDEIDIDLPKNLFRKFHKFGVLEWPDLYSVCKKKIDLEIMALRFSRTFLFKRKISLNSMRIVFEEEGIKESLQSPTRIPFSALKKFYALGF